LNGHRASSAPVWPAAWAALALLLLSACAGTPQPAQPGAEPRPAPVATGADDPPPPPAGAVAGAGGRVVGRSAQLAVYVPAPGDRLPEIARRLLGDARLDWRIADANGRWEPEAGVPLLVPLQAPPAVGVDPDGYQTVPILCYHRFGAGQSKMIVSPERFEEQLAWLQRNRYNVLRLSELQGFLEARKPLPERSVVITIDDGYETVHRHAFPALKKYGFTATLFVYADFVGSRDGLSWAQLQEMAQSGVIDIQAHSKTHRNLVQRRQGESEPAYRQSLLEEARHPRALLEKRLADAGVKVTQFAYPFGDANEQVLQVMEREGYELAVTVNPGGNPFFAHPLMLRRTMIFGDHDLDDFKARLQTRRPLAGRP
jgi:peptidoglycan/xylan/chitin deacetylase (PgdA/CDA1 family)